MPDDGLMVASAERAPKAAHRNAVRKEAGPRHAGIILDMGEASREEGFRLNGSR